MAKFKISERYNSFKYAAKGIFTMILSQHNAWIHALITVLAVIAGFCFGLTKPEWCWIILAIITVWTAETLNTAFEFLLDVASPEFHPLAEKAKNVAAGAVLISAIGAMLIGLLIFSPHIIKALQFKRHFY